MVVGQFAQEAHLVVIGGGAGGCAAARRAAELGVQTVLVDATGLSGGFTWSTLRRVVSGETKLPAIRKRLDEESAHHAQTRRRALEEAGVQIIQGVARFEDARQVAVHDGVNVRVRFKRAIVSIGSTAIAPPGGWPESKRVTDWRRALDLNNVPGTLLVAGGGPIALEVAFVLAALGSDVSLVTQDPRLLPEADPGLLEPVEARLRETLDTIRHATTVAKLRDVPDGIEVHFTGAGSPKRRVFDHVIVALGSRPDTDDLGLSKAKVEHGPDGSIPVDEKLRTSNPRIFAAGDVTGEPFLAAKAARQATVAAEVIAGRDHVVFAPQALPRVVHCDVPIAWCGLTEADAKETDTPYRVSEASRCDGALARLLFEPESKILLGAGIVGPGAEEAIGEAALAVEMGAVADDLAETVHPYGTTGALMAEAARSV